MRTLWSVVFLSACAAPLGAPSTDQEGERKPPGYDPSCDRGAHCRPIHLDPLPLTISGDTSTATERHIDRYGCAPDTDESGPEIWYAFELSNAGRVTASIDEVSGDGIDVDVHLLTGTEADDCIARGHERASADVDPGHVFVVVDSWVDGDGVEQSGPFELTVEVTEPGSGDCAMVDEDMEMVWSSCASSIDCSMSGGDAYLHLPATGPVVKEAHLVTTDDGFGSSWPGSYWEGIEAHYALSETVSGYTTSRTEPWAPAGEGGSEFGQGSTGGKIPAEDEAWYINMYWADRPAKGTRFIVRNPANGRAVVASGGFETGPGANTAIAGVAEEIHDWLGTTHLDTLEVGRAEDGSLPLGPIECP